MTIEPRGGYSATNMAANTKKPSTRKPATLRPSKMGLIKCLFHKRGHGLSLKQWLRSPSAPTDAEFQAAAADWLFNKRANASKPELCIGKTRRKKGADGKKKDAAAPTKKK